MPISVAASLSSDTARMALPSLVLSMNSVSAAISAAVTASVSTVMPSTCTPPTVKPGSFTSVGYAICWEPKISSAAFCKR